MSKNQATFSVPDNTMVESSPVSSSVVNLSPNTITSPNPKEESHPHSTTSPTHSESTPHLSKSKDVCPSPVSPVKQSQEGKQGNLVRELSTLSMAEHLSEDLVISHEETDTTIKSCDYIEGVIIEECAGGSMHQREETEEEGAFVPFEQSAQDDATRVPNDEPDPSMEDPGQDSSPRSSKRSRRRRRLVKDGKVIQAEDVPVVDVDEETKEEPSSLTRKSSRKKHSLSQSKRHTSKGAESSSNGVVAGSSKKLTEQVRGEGKVCWQVSEKEEDDEEEEEPSSVKKGKVSGTLRSEKRKLGNQKVLWGCTFASDILESTGMRQLVDICDS
ncbi:uncharacterized protein [Nicotiana sylvestris]|uniref:uncharacterized protein n=1 Tax=Nicotiana sylvestris TaxID=4096 RepID=UPI00388CCF21